MPFFRPQQFAGSSANTVVQGALLPANNSYTATPTVTSLAATSFVSVGATVAGSGSVRLANGSGVSSRRSDANTANLILLTGSNNVAVGDSTQASNVNCYAATGFNFFTDVTVRFAVTSSTSTFSFDSGGNVIIGGGYVSIGTTPALSGGIRLPNNTGSQIKARRTDAADCVLIWLTGGNNVAVGDGVNAVNLNNFATTSIGAVIGSNLRMTVTDTTTTFLHGGDVVVGGGYVSIGTTTATTGAVRLPNNVGVVGRRTTAADTNIIILNNNNNIVVGDSVNAVNTNLYATTGINSLIGANLRLAVLDTTSTFSHTGGNVVVGGGYVQVGSGTVASTGALAVPNNTVAVAARNQANSGDITLLSTNASNTVLLGGAGNTQIDLVTSAGSVLQINNSALYLYGGQSTHLGGWYSPFYSTSSVNGATSGLVRGANNTTLVAARNAAASADLNVLSTNASNEIYLGNISNNGSNVNINGGNKSITNGNGGFVNIQSGAGLNGTSGAVYLASSGDLSTGILSLSTGAASTGVSGGVFISTGAASNNNSGNIDITTGNSTTNASGTISLIAGNGSTSDDGGGIIISAGSGGSAPGSVTITAGAKSSTAGAGGDITLTGGSGVSALAGGGAVSINGGPGGTGYFGGDVSILSGTGPVGSGNISLKSANSSGLSGIVELGTGTGTLTAGVNISTGNASVGASGDIILDIGTAATTIGTHRFQFAGNSIVKFVAPAGAAKYIFIQDQGSSAYPTAEVNGGLLFVQNGALKWRSGSGVITTIAEA